MERKSASQFNVNVRRNKRPKTLCHIALPEFVPFNSEEPSSAESMQSESSMRRNSPVNSLITCPIKQEKATFYNEGSSSREGSQQKYQHKHQRIRYRSRSPRSSSGASDSNGYTEEREYFDSMQRNSRSVFNRLGFSNRRQHHSSIEIPHGRHSPIYYESNETENDEEEYPARQMSDERHLYRHDMPEDTSRQLNIIVRCTNSMDRSRSVIYDSNQAEIIHAIRTLESDQQELMMHCNGLKDSVEDYFREISKLETLVLLKSQEIDALKRRLNLI